MKKFKIKIETLIIALTYSSIQSNTTLAKNIASIDLCKMCKNNVTSSLINKVSLYSLMCCCCVVLHCAAS